MKFFTYISQSEEIFSGAVREVKEETGVREFVLSCKQFVLFLT